MKVREKDSKLLFKFIFNLDFDFCTGEKIM